MTAINRVIKRETLSTERGTPICVELHPAYLVARLKGKRTRYTVDYAAVLWLGIKAEVERQRAEKRAARRGRKAI